MQNASFTQEKDFQITNNDNIENPHVLEILKVYSESVLDRS